MLHPLRAAARFIDQKIGWSRVGLALSLVIIVSAATVLYRILRGLNAADVLVAAGYFTLTFYDLFALRTIGKREVPYRIAALAAFTSYSVGHNIGATVF